MNRLFILGSIKFPRGTAGANYEQYFALSLMELGWKVIILGVGENRKQDFDGTTYKYRNIEYYNAQNWKQVKYGMGVSFYKEMAEKYQFSEDDYFVLRDLGWQSINWLIKNFGINHVSYIHFDDLRPSQFKLPYINPQYWTNVYKWNLKFRKIKKAFPISEALEKKEKKYGCTTLRLPIMADPEEYGVALKVSKPSKIQFIYPGAKLNGCEDDIDLMLDAFNSLSEEEKAKVVFHITGTTEEKLKSKIKNPSVLDKLKDVVIVHSWMEYSDLIALYKQMDYLVLARFDNELTRANFPSKIPENMCYGIVPICSKVGDYTTYYLKNMVDSIFCEVGSKKSLVDAIRMGIKMPDDKFVAMHENSRKTAIEKFGYRNWASKIEDFLLN